MIRKSHIWVKRNELLLLSNIKKNSEYAETIALYVYLGGHEKVNMRVSIKHFVKKEIIISGFQADIFVEIGITFLALT